MSDDALRPTNWSHFVGQKNLKSRLSIHILSSKQRNVLLPHVLLNGPPGSGKTTLAGILADSMDHQFSSYIMPFQDKILPSILMGNYGQVVLFDELHRCSKAQQEMLLTVVEDNYLQMPGGRRINCAVTLIGATTERDKIITPLYDRFQIKPEFEEYSDDELAEIVKGMAERLGLTLEDEEAVALGKASGGVPRNARRLICTYRDISLVLSESNVKLTLETNQIEEDGLEIPHLKILKHLQNNSSAGLSVLATVLDMPEGAVRQVEKLLIRKGYISFGKTGRELTGAGYGRLSKLNKR